MGSVEAAILEGDEDGAASRVVALKRILRAEGSDPRRVEMFLREARLTTLLDHPNVVRALSYGECSGELFLAMEYIAGEPLSRLVTLTTEHYERLPPPVVAYILAEACEGLHAAHELRDADGEPLHVVHRDVSPHNVMIGFDGSVKLLDFGVAKIEALESAGRTKTGEVKGKTAYMSPEQAMGEPIDRRSDLYSMGAVLFECLTGRRMWGVGTDLEVLRRLALDAPPSLSGAAVDAPPALARLHARLIERDRAARPATAREVATELRMYIESSGIAVDRELLIATMGRLFNDERQRREGAIRRALAATPARAGEEARSTAANESGPVFATDGGVVSHVHAGRGARAVWSGGAALLMLAVAGGALWYRDSGRAPAAANETAPQSAATAAPRESIHRVEAASSTTAIPSASDRALVAPKELEVLAPRTLVPTVSTGAPKARANPAGTNQAASPPPPGSARREPPTSSVDSKPGSGRQLSKPTEPPDVDPTPF